MSDHNPRRATDSERQTPWIDAPPKASKGRGAISNMQGRYEAQTRENIDDGWRQANDDEKPGRSAPATQVIFEQAKSILTRNTSPDIPFNVSLNPYRGCEHVIFRYMVCD